MLLLMEEKFLDIRKIQEIKLVLVEVQLKVQMKNQLKVYLEVQFNFFLWMEVYLQVLGLRYKVTMWLNHTWVIIIQFIKMMNKRN